MYDDATNAGMGFTTPVGGVQQCPTAAAGVDSMPGVPNSNNLTEELLDIVRLLATQLAPGSGSTNSGTCRSCGMSRGGSSGAASSSEAGITGRNSLSPSTQSSSKGASSDITSLFDVGGSIIGSLFGEDAGSTASSILGTVAPFAEELLPLMFAML